MGGRHRSGAGQNKASRGAVVGSTGAVLLLCGALVYGVSGLGYDQSEPDPPKRSAVASKVASLPPAGTPTLAVPEQRTPGADMNRQEPAPRATQPPQTTAAPSTSQAQRKSKKPRSRPSSPRVRRSGNCYLYEYNGVTYKYCPDRTGSPRR